MPQQYHGIGAIILATLMIASALSAGGLATDTAGSQAQDGRETIDGCTTITEPGTYVLEGDIDEANGTCIRIQSSDVVLDGNGHAIEGVTNESRRTEFREASMAPSVVFSDDETAQNETLVEEVTANYPWPTNPRWANIGIAATASEGLSNVTVRDVTVREFVFGVYLDGVSDADVQNVTADSNGDGFDIFNTTDVTVSDVRVLDNQWGLFGLNVTNATISGVAAEGNAVTALPLILAPDAVISDASISDNPIGVILAASNDSEVVNTSITESAYAGVGVMGSDGVRVANTTASNTTADVPAYLEPYPAPFAAASGIALDDAGDGIYRDVTLTDNADWGYFAANGSANNSGDRVGIDGATVAFTATDAALNTVDSAPIEAEQGWALGDGLIAANTAANASLTIRVEWSEVEPAETASPTPTPTEPAENTTA